MSTETRLNRVDESGVFALPDGVTADHIAEVLLDGVSTEHVYVKSDTEIDVPLARPGSVVTIILREV